MPGKDIKLVDAIVQKFNMSADQEYGFRDYIHELKDSGFFGSKKRGDFTYKELVQIAREYLGLTDE